MTPEQAVFTQIYDDAYWSNGSGSGSHPDNTRAYRDWLESFVRDNCVASVVDFGCGDWQFSRLIDWGTARYLGVDLVESVIQRNIARYQTERIRFAVARSMDDGLPPADLLIVKDVLQHWPNRAIHALRPRLGEYRYVLITNTRVPAIRKHPVDRSLNRDIELGRHRPVDLTRPPFEWPVREVLRYESRRPGASTTETKVTVLMTN